MKSALLYLVFPLLMGLVSLVWHPSRATWNAPEPVEGEVRLKETQIWDSDLIWVDARESELYQKEHIPKSISLNDENFEEQLPVLLEQWQPGIRIVVYCDTQLCDASHSMAERLKKEIGLSDVWVLYGGWSAWKKAKK